MKLLLFLLLLLLFPCSSFSSCILDPANYTQELIEEAVRSCRHVVFSSGRFVLSRPLNFSLSHQVIEINAQIEAPLYYPEWPVVAALPSYPSRGRRFNPGFYFFDVYNSSVLGSGSVKGQGKSWWKVKESLPFERPRLFQCQNCSNFSLFSVSFFNSPFWTVHMYQSHHIVISDIVVDNPIDSPNTDGVDVDSCFEVRVSDVKVKTGDDCIAIKSGLVPFGEPCANVLVENSEFSFCAGLAIGSEVGGGVVNVTFANNRLKFVNNVVRIKSQAALQSTVIF
jgi:hypothetical protein